MNKCQLKPGDIIASYYAGVHEVVAIERRFFTKEDLRYLSSQDIVVHKCVLKSNGTPVSSHKPKHCDASYCHKITAAEVEAEYKATVEQAQKKKDAILALLKGK